jgi:hypothetical protein
MDTIKQTPKTLEFSRSLSPIVRVLIAIFGFIPFLAPYKLLIKPSWQGEFSLALVFFLAISFGAILVSLFFFAVALFGRSQHFQFDASKRLLVYRFKTAFNPSRQEIYDFDQIESLEVKTNEWDSRPDTYDIAVKIVGKSEMKFGDFLARTEAQRYLAALQKMLAES